MSTTPKMVNGIVKRGAVWYYVITTFNPTTGKRRTVMKSAGKGATKEDAKRLKREAEGKVNSGVYVAPVKLTVNEYLDRWLIDIRPTIKAKSYAGYVQNVRNYLKPALGDFQLQALKPGLLGKAFADLVDHGGRDGRALSTRTVDGARRILRKALNDAVTDGHIATNPVLKAKMPKSQTVANDESRILTPTQLKAVLKKLEAHRLFALFHLAAFTGMRRGECVGLRWRDVDLEASEVTVRVNVTRGGGERHHTTPKSDKPRVVALDPGTVAALKAHRSRQAAERLKVGAAWRGGDADWLFTTARGEHVAPEYPSRLWFTTVRGVLTELPAGQTFPRFHDLRHTHATTLLKAGVPAYQVAARLGHADATVTLKMYAHYLPADGRHLGDAFAAALA